MWNLVTTANGINYLVDVTNCDEGTIGAPDKLFMKGYSRVGVNDKGKTIYYYDFIQTDCSYFVSYVYDDSTKQLYNEDELIISDSDFDENALLHEVTWTISPEHPNMNTGVIIQLDQEYTAIYYSVKDADNETVAEGQLSDTDAIDIQGLSAGDYTVSIRCAEDTIMLEEIDVHITILDAPTLIAYPSVIGEPVATYVPTFLDGDNIAITYQIDSAVGVSQRYLILQTNGGPYSMIELGDSAEGTWTLTPEEYGEFVDKGTIHLNAALTDLNESNLSAEQADFQIVSCDLRLPENLTSIEAEAFAGITNKSVYIPENVTAIEDGAFDETMTIMCKRGSWAEQWAVAKGLQPTLID